MDRAVREKRIVEVLVCDVALLLLILMGLVGCLLFWLGESPLKCFCRNVSAFDASRRRHVLAHRLGDTSRHRLPVMAAPSAGVVSIDSSPSETLSDQGASEGYGEHLRVPVLTN